MKHLIPFIALAVTGAMTSMPLVASAQETASSNTTDSKVLIVHDWSNSMWGAFADGERKYLAGVTALTAALDGGFGGRDVGYRAYGHTQPGDCRDSELISDFAPLEQVRPAIVETLSQVRPTGKTPITYSLKQGLSDFDGAPGDILLISDGIETCDADPCDLMREWTASNVSIRVHVVGVGLNEMERSAMACIADESGGKYFDADSAEGFEEALSEVAETIEVAEAEPEPAAPTGTIGLRINTVDEDGRAYRSSGKIFFDGEQVGTAASAGYGRNVVDEPGDYEIEIGPLLSDGSIYRPVRQTVTVSAGSDTTVTVIVNPPARVKAIFTEAGERHSGAHVTAWQDGEEAFSFRAKDEALATPGEYEFRSTPNGDNSVSQTATLTAGDLTTVEFELIETVRAKIQFELPDGEIIRRHSELWQNGEKIYGVLSGNGAVVRPGTYELRADDQNAPLTPVAITIDQTDDKTYIVPLDVGWVRISFPEDPYNYINSRVPSRATLISVDRGGTKYSRPGTRIPVAPGQYAIAGFEADGFFDRPDVQVSSGQTVDVTVTPEALGELVMTYAPSDNYQRDPDRGSAQALDGQRIVGGILRPGDVRKLYPGRYLIKGFSAVGDIEAQEVVLTAGERTEITLKLRGE